MKPTSDNELLQALEELRPEPSPTFAAELDARVAAGFPRDSRAPGFATAGLFDWVRSLKPTKVLLPAGALAVTVLLVVGVVVSQNGGSKKSQVSLSRDTSAAEMAAPESSGSAGRAADPARSAEAAKPAQAESGSDSGPMYESESATLPDTRSTSSAQPQYFDGSGPYVRGSKRAIERSSQLTLGTEPENVGKASSEVFGVVHDYRGVVLSSQTSDGSTARAEAEFELLIPSGKLGDAMAAFSRIAEVRSRHEATNDITAPTVSTAAHLEDSRARIDSLLGQLAAAEAEGEREAVERELRGERKRAAALEASLDNLEKRASLSRVSLRIVGGDAAAAPDEGGTWGIGDALDDAAKVLGIAAAVTLLALAVLAPIALVALLIWLARRTYLRRARQTALG